MKFIFIPLLALLFLGCGDPKIDASTDETMKSSVYEIRRSLPEDQKDKFYDALQTVIFYNMMPPNGSKVKLQDALDGKNAKEVLVEAQKIEKELSKRRAEQAIEKVAPKKELSATEKAISDKERIEKMVNDRLQANGITLGE